MRTGHGAKAAVYAENNSCTKEVSGPVGVSRELRRSLSPNYSPVSSYTRSSVSLIKPLLVVSACQTGDRLNLDDGVALG